MGRKKMIEYVLMITTVLGAIIALMQRDLLKAAILTGIPGVSIAFLYQYLLAPDVALTQAIVGSAIVPVFFALAVLRTRRTEE
jgi:energy-converting hydrogenase B subunit D